MAPVEYTIEIEPMMETSTFKGKTSIKIKTRTPSDEIIVNAVGLCITKATVECEGEKPQEVSHRAIEDKEQVAFGYKTEGGNEITLVVEYTSEFNQNMSGFYLSRYKDGQGNEKRIATTHFEPADARRAFPCFDEPEQKAIFIIILKIENGHSGISNMNIKETTPMENNKTKIEFDPSPIMSTYLVAFIVGEFDTITQVNDEGVEIRCFTTPGQVESARYSLEIAAKCLSFFSGFFSVPYPLPKLDMIGLPDFAAGAMENWGLVTYRLTAMLYDPEKSSILSKQRVAYVVCHELAHQWFGNLVTMKWWSDLWLNEGFATWAGTRAVDHIHPEWDTWSDFVSDELCRGLSLDGMDSTHAIQVPVNSPAEVSEIFDAISYSKGASVLRMLVNYIGEDLFVKGITAYLNEYKYSNAETNDLWRHLEQASNLPVAKVMSEWTLCPGYPLLSADYKDGMVTLTQSRFSFGEKQSDERWQIPITANTEKGIISIASNDLLCEKESSFPVDGFSFLKINPDQTGFFRVSYSGLLLDQIKEAILKNKLSASDRIGIVTDLFALCRFGKTSLLSTIKAIRNLQNEPSYFVWSKIVSGLSSILSVWWEEDETIQEGINEYCQRLVKSKVEEMGISYEENEGEIKQLLRTTLIGFAVKVGLPSTSSECMKLFTRCMEGDKTAIHPNLLRVVLEHGVYAGGKKEFDFVLDFYTKEDVADRKIAALASLGATEDKESIERALELTIDSSPDALVRGQDVIYVLSSLMRNKKARRPLWNFVQKNWSLYRERFVGSSISMLNSILYCSGCGLTTEADIASYRSFFDSQDKTGIEMKIRQTVEEMSINSHMLSTNKNEISQWIDEQHLRKKARVE